ncbi:cyclophilin-like domain-containing protein [Pilobolus umbonatus]|nr:cyclophilin-like domain-containing protein [Pilobolus umbonatus]
MSNIYALEPHTNGKVILYTTAGDIEIELWGKETPKATRNFIQLCLEGYYDNTIFHRIVPDFIVQGGDPTGTGQGGESIYEEGLPDEFHSRLRFNRRGLVGLANTGKDDNGSQFFITLDRADELTKKHTLFGRVAGDTLFNVMKMTELELENERPLYPPRIKRTEVVLNPFDDILPRITAQEKKAAELLEKTKREEAMAKKRKKGLKKQLNLLSFGDEAAEMEPASEDKPRIKSVYDMNDTSAQQLNPLEEQIKELKEKEVQEAAERISDKAKGRSDKVDNKVEEVENKVVDKVDKMVDNADKIENTMRNEMPKPLAAEERLSAIEKLKQDIRNISKVKDEEVPVERKEKKKSLVAMEREKYTKRKKGNPRDLLSELMAFKNKLATAKEESTSANNKKDRPNCELHGIPNCESCFDSSVLKDDEVTDEGWISHKLVFDKDLKGKDLMQRKETVDDYVVIDPRDREAEAKQIEYEKRRSKKTINPAFRKRERENDEGRHRYDDRKRHDDRRR